MDYRNWRQLIRPKKLEVDHESLTPKFGRFVAEPLERGFGITIGNSLRRILLSSLRGAAIIGVEIEGLEGQRFASPQYRVLARLLQDVITRHPVDDIVGHEHVAPGRKQDPGAGFDWMRLRRALPRSRAGIWPLIEPTR